MKLRLIATWGAGLVVCLLITPVSLGKFIPVQLQEVPVERLVTNLEAAAKKDSKNVETLINLARVHGMAYSLKTASAQVAKGRENAGVWFGYVPIVVPYHKVVKANDKVKEKTAKVHLDKSLARFREAVKLAPDNLAARLGLAWTLEQAGEKNEAIERYRDLIDDAWKTEKTLTQLPIMARETIVTEAAGYLLPLLDKKNDRQEVAVLSARMSRLRALPRPITPIAVPLRDGLQVQDIEDQHAAVLFDADGSGRKQRWTWIRQDAGWLVFDPHGKGNITSGLQLFGNVTFWLFWQNGYEALASLDDNGDGALTGSELDGLAIWQDARGDGICDPAEVKPLAHHGIVAVSCRHEQDPGHPDRIAFSPRGLTFQSGAARPTFDLILKPAAGRAGTPSR